MQLTRFTETRTRRPGWRRSALLALALAATATVAATTGPAATRDGSARDPAGGARTEVVFVANAEAGTVSVIDARSRRVVAELDVLPDGPDATLGEDDPVQALAGQRVVEAAGGTNYAQDLDVSPDGRTLYVSRGHRGDVAAFDLASGEMRWKTPISGVRADHMTLSPDGRRLYVSALTADVVEVVDTTDGEVVDSFPTGEWPHDSHFSGDAELLYNASIGNITTPWELREARTTVSTDPPVGPYQLTVVDPETLEPVDHHGFERGIRPFVLTDDGTRLYAQLSELHGLVEYDLRDREITRQLELPVDAGVTEDDYDFEAPHHGLAMSPDGSTLCVAGRASDYAALVSTDTFAATAVVDVGDAPSWAANDPSGRHCYLANNRDGTVSVVSYAAGREVARIPTGAGPKYLVGARIPAGILAGTADG
jgi:DNA-binding beta-propeller fold protein YncE